MKVNLVLTIPGTCSGESNQDIYVEGPDGGFRILKPDIITLQTRTGSPPQRGTVIGRVATVRVGETGQGETPEEYLSRLFLSYLKFSKMQSKVKELEDISSKINKLCTERELFNPLTGGAN